MKKDIENNNFLNEDVLEETITSNESTIGNILRETREKLGEEIEDIASFLRIRKHYLEAIEEGRYNDLPGNAYVMGFLRSYSEYLGLDADKIIKIYKDEQNKSINSSAILKTEINTKQKHKFNINNIHIIIASLSILTIILVWFIYDMNFNKNENIKTSEEVLVTEVKEEMPEIIAPVEKDIENNINLKIMASFTNETKTSSEQKEIITEVIAEKEQPKTQIQKPSENINTNIQDNVQNKPQIISDAAKLLNNLLNTKKEEDEKAAAIAPMQKQEEITSKLYGNKESSRIYIKATEEVWVSVKNDVTEEVLFDKVLKIGDIYYVPVIENLLLTIGNAGGLEIYADDKKIPSFGPKGAKRSNIKLDPEALKNGTAYLG